MKRKVNHKESDWPQFNEHVKSLVNSQHEEVIWSLSQRGKFSLKPEYAHYSVTTQEWMKMRTDKRQQIVSNFQKASIKVSATCFKKVSSTYRTGESISINDDIVQEVINPHMSFHS